MERIDKVIESMISEMPEDHRRALYQALDAGKEEEVRDALVESPAPPGKLKPCRGGWRFRCPEDAAAFHEAIYTDAATRFTANVLSQIVCNILESNPTDMDAPETSSLLANLADDMRRRHARRRAAAEAAVVQELGLPASVELCWDWPSGVISVIESAVLKDLGIPSTEQIRWNSPSGGVSESDAVGPEPLSTVQQFIAEVSASGFAGGGYLVRTDHHNQRYQAWHRDSSLKTALEGGTILSYSFRRNDNSRWAVTWFRDQTKQHAFGATAGEAIAKAWSAGAEV